jgi:hypothetical protein
MVQAYILGRQSSQTAVPLTILYPLQLREPTHHYCHYRSLDHSLSFYKKGENRFFDDYH